MRMPRLYCAIVRACATLRGCALINREFTERSKSRGARTDLRQSAFEGTSANGAKRSVAFAMLCFRNLLHYLSQR